VKQKLYAEMVLFSALLTLIPEDVRKERGGCSKHQAVRYLSNSQTAVCEKDGIVRTLAF